MSSQKSPITQKRNLSLRMTQKPQLLQCSDVSCYHCYEMYPDGFSCPRFRLVNIAISCDLISSLSCMRDTEYDDIYY